MKSYWINIIKLIFYYTVTTAIIAYLLLGKILFNLNSTQLDRSGDGFKNYFTFAYQYKYGDGLWFDGMQYPFGDLLMYADGQPAILLPVKALKFIGVDLSHYLLFTIQSLPILSIVFAGVLLHKIMRQYHTPEWWTILTVSFCLALSPQLFRFNSHFALGYLFCFPLIWYLLIKLDKGLLKKSSYIFLTTATLIFVGFIHPYHILICALFLLAWFTVNIFSKKFRFEVLLSAIISIVIFMLLNKYLDPFLDRPQNPYGIWRYKTEISDLLPFYGWYRNIFEGTLSIRTYYSEGYSYTGILFFIVPFLFIYQKTKKVSLKFNNSYFLAALLMLSFGMGLHLLLTGQQILEWLTPLKQFRSLGRFSWVFYYVAFISFSAYFFHWTQRIKNKKIKIGVWAFVILFWTIDSYSYTTFFKNQIRQYIAPNELRENTIIKDALSEKNIDLENFQAVLPLPVSLEGAEKFTPKDNWFVKTATIPFVYQSGIPMFGAHMSRTSISNALQTQAISSSAYVEKSICDKLDHDKNILVIINKEDKVHFADLLKSAVIIDETEVLEMLSIHPSDLCIVNYFDIDSTIKSDVLFYSSNGTANGLHSNGALKIDNKHRIAKMNLADTIQNITCSSWVLIDSDNTAVPNFLLSTINNKGETIETLKIAHKDIKRFEVIGNWVQFKFDVNLPEGAHSLNWRIIGHDLLIDHAIISITGQQFFIPLKDDYFIYDHYIGKLKPKDIEE